MGEQIPIAVAVELTLQERQELDRKRAKLVRLRDDLDYCMSRQRDLEHEEEGLRDQIHDLESDLGENW